MTADDDDDGHPTPGRCPRCGRWLAWVGKSAFEDLTQGDLADALNRFAAGKRGAPE